MAHLCWGCLWQTESCAGSTHSIFHLCWFCAGSAWFFTSCALQTWCFSWFRECHDSAGASLCTRYLWCNCTAGYTTAGCALQTWACNCLGTFENTLKKIPFTDVLSALVIISNENLLLNDDRLLLQMQSRQASLMIGICVPWFCFPLSCCCCFFWVPANITTTLYTVGESSSILAFVWVVAVAEWNLIWAQLHAFERVGHTTRWTRHMAVDAGNRHAAYKQHTCTWAWARNSMICSNFTIHGSTLQGYGMQAAKGMMMARRLCTIQNALGWCAANLAGLSVLSMHWWTWHCFFFLLAGEHILRSTCHLAYTYSLVNTTTILESIMCPKALSAVFCCCAWTVSCFLLMCRNSIVLTIATWCAWSSRTSTAGHVLLAIILITATGPRWFLLRNSMLQILKYSTLAQCARCLCNSRVWMLIWSSLVHAWMTESFARSACKSRIQKLTYLPAGQCAWFLCISIEQLHAYCIAALTATCSFWFWHACSKWRNDLLTHTFACFTNTKCRNTMLKTAATASPTGLESRQSYRRFVILTGARSNSSRKHFWAYHNVLCRKLWLQSSSIIVFATGIFMYSLLSNGKKFSLAWRLMSPWTLCLMQLRISEHFLQNL